ncbi:hypothetical protein GCM10009654_33120 [Streptomyces hebeiensis]|uniref:Uncharacterized protein n=1 Tax=Streptomyces hebeiensis TaxID=229486 RepID=A0ABN1UY02_9ACTN
MGIEKEEVIVLVSHANHFPHTGVRRLSVRIAPGSISRVEDSGRLEGRCTEKGCHCDEKEKKDGRGKGGW